MTFYARILILFLTAIPAVFAQQPNANDKMIGWLEEVAIQVIGDYHQPNLSFTATAKIDTGADNSSMDAQDIEYIMHNNRQWVRFYDKQQRVYQSPLISLTAIKMKDGRHQQRPVIEVKICIGSLLQTIQMNLVDRSHFKYPILIGRSAMQGILIDPSNTFLKGQPACQP